MTVKRVLCLANSRKLNGRCVAGIVVEEPDEWIRPVSDREHQEVSEYERQYEDGGDPQVLDLIDIPLLERAPLDFQKENWLLNPKYYWSKVGQFDVGQLEPYCQKNGTLWMNGTSTYNGLNDTIPVETASTLDSSLTLIRVNALDLHVWAPGEAFGNSKRRVQARFNFDDAPYQLWVTDPKVERAYLAQDDGQHSLGPSFLTISLGEPFQGSTNKLVAAVIPGSKGGAT